VTSNLSIVTQFTVLRYTTHFTLKEIIMTQSTNVATFVNQLAGMIGAVKKDSVKLVTKVQNIFVAVDKAGFEGDELVLVVEKLITEMGDIRGVNAARIVTYAKACLRGGVIRVKKDGLVIVKPIKDADEFTFSVEGLEEWDVFTKPEQDKKPVTSKQAIARVDKLVTQLTGDLSNAEVAAILRDAIDKLEVTGPIRIAS